MILLERRTDLDLEVFRRVAWAGEAVALSPAALERIAARRATMLELLSHEPERHVYGTTTLPGDGVRQRLSAEERLTYQRHVTAPPASFGEALPERVTRGMVLARLTNLVDGHAGVRPELAAGVAALLAGAPLPRVPLRGNTFEVFAASHLFGELVEGLGGLETKEPMALVNGSFAATALVADVALQGRRRLPLVEQAIALAGEAVLVPLEHFHPDLEGFWGDEHEADALRRMRELLEGAAPERRAFQAPVSYRIIPRVLGQLRRAQAAAERAAETSLCAVTDNPVYALPDGERPLGELFSSGGFHNAHALQAIDGLAFAWAELCQLIHHQAARLVDDPLALGGLPRGAWGVEGTAREVSVYGNAQVEWAYEAAELARPTLMPLVGNASAQTDAASMTFSAWRKAVAIGRCLDASVTALALAASESLAATARGVPPRLAPFAARVRRHRPPGAAWATTGHDADALFDELSGLAVTPQEPAGR